MLLYSIDHDPQRCHSLEYLSRRQSKSKRPSTKHSSTWSVRWREVSSPRSSIPRCYLASWLITL